jgi:hypothetical protein
VATDKMQRIEADCKAVAARREVPDNQLAFDRLAGELKGVGPKLTSQQDTMKSLLAGMTQVQSQMKGMRR